MTKVVITGAGGQLGQSLLTTAPPGTELLVADRHTLDITDDDSVHRYFDTHKPDGVINAAAYTAVDKAESEPEAAELVNAVGAGNLARASADAGAHLVHVSTDFVFDGQSSTPYKTDHAVNPINVYGSTKARGEQAVLSVPSLEATVMRTAWVYSAEGGNFLTTMLRLMKERETLNIVADQVGTPTSASGLAQACWVSWQKRLAGIHHWTDAGVASWYDFAVAIHREARRLGILERDTEILPIPASQFPTPAKRPGNSVLDKSGTWAQLQIAPRHWQDQLEVVLRAVKLKMS